MAIAPEQSATDRRLRVFLSHSSDDKPPVRNLYRRLLADGFAPWLDEEELLPGQDWRKEIQAEVRACDAVIVCLSKKSVGREGYLQKEIREALSVAEEKPEGTIFIVPLRLEEVDVPESLTKWHSADLFRESGYQRLVLSLKARASAIGIRVVSELEPARRRPDFRPPTLPAKAQPPVRSTYPEFLDFVVWENQQLALVAEPAGDQILLDPDGMRFRDRRVELVSYRNGEEQAREFVARLFLPPSRHAILQVDSNIRIFIAYKVASGAYTMCGNVYEHDGTTLKAVRSEPLFMGQNWGWFAIYDGPDVVQHFSFDGYHWVRNTTPTERISPAAAEAVHIGEVLEHSRGLLRLRRKGASDEEQAKADEPIALWLRTHKP